MILVGLHNPPGGWCLPWGPHERWNRRRVRCGCGATELGGDDITVKCLARVAIVVLCFFFLLFSRFLFAQTMMFHFFCNMFFCLNLYISKYLLFSLFLIFC